MDRLRQDDRGPDGPHTDAPTLDQVYAAIMSQKRTAQGLPQEPPARGPGSGAVRFRSGLGASLRNGTLEQLLLQGLVAGSDDGQGGPLAIMRSNTMENILRDTASGGKDLQDLMMDWNHLPDEHKFVEGLASDMDAIDAAPPDVQTMRRTFTLERILSGAETDLAGMLRANHHQQQLQRQQSGAAGSGGAAGSSGGGGGGGGGEGAGGEAGPPGRPGARGDKPQCADSLHRLAASSGPGSLPRSALAAAGAANGGGGGPAGCAPMGPPSSRGLGGGLLRSGGGSGRYGGAAAAALITEEEESLSRSPKRARLLPQGKAEAALGAVGPGAERTWGKAEACLGAGLGGPDRTMSASLLELAKAAAALDGGDPDEGSPPGEGQRQGRSAGTGEEEEQEEQRQEQRQEQVAGVDGAAAGVVVVQCAEPDAAPAAGAGSPEAGGTGRQAEAARKGSDSSAPDGSDGGGASPRPGGGASPPRGSGAAAAPAVGGRAAAAPNAGEGGIAELLRTLSGLKPGQAAGAPLGRSSLQPQDTKMMQRLQAEVERLQRDNGALSGHLESVLSQVDVVQQRNARMKQMLLEACHAKGIQADMSLLNMSLQHHRTQPLTEAQATHVAASILGLNGGNVLASVQQMIGIALLRSTEGQQRP